MGMPMWETDGKANGATPSLSTKFEVTGPCGWARIVTALLMDRSANGKEPGTQCRRRSGAMYRSVHARMRAFEREHMGLFKNGGWHVPFKVCSSVEGSVITGGRVQLRGSLRKLRQRTAKRV